MKTNYFRDWIEESFNNSLDPLRVEEKLRVANVDGNHIYPYNIHDYEREYWMRQSLNSKEAAIRKRWSPKLAECNKALDYWRWVLKGGNEEGSNGYEEAGEEIYELFRGAARTVGNLLDQIGGCDRAQDEELESARRYEKEFWTPNDRPSMFDRFF